MCYITFETAVLKVLFLQGMIDHYKNRCILTLEHLSFNHESGHSNVLEVLKLRGLPSVRWYLSCFPTFM